MRHQCPACKQETPHREVRPAARTGWRLVKCERCNYEHYIAPRESVNVRR